MTPAFVLTEVVDKRRQTAPFYWLRAPTFLTTYTVYMYEQNVCSLIIEAASCS